MSGSSPETAFGYYPAALSIKAGEITIETLPDLDGRIAAVVECGTIEDDWFYAPLYADKPYVSRVFGLPKTHLLGHGKSDGSKHITFMIWALSFFLGMRLTATEMGFLDATTIKPGKLVDFHTSKHDLVKLLILADNFWAANRAEPLQAKRLGAAIHALFLGQYRKSLQFERFGYLYTGLDTCFALAKFFYPPPYPKNHAKRIDWMCGKLGMTTPTWAVPVSGKTVLAEIRNNAIHEALFSDAPLGFGLHSGDLTLEMQNVICRFLIALLGASSAGYVRTPTDTREYQALNL